MDPPSHSPTQRSQRLPKHPALNPLQLAIQTFLTTHHPSRPPLSTPLLLPKRYTLHPPLLLLPPTFPAQIHTLLSLPPTSTTTTTETINLTPLFRLLTSLPSPIPITHIAYPSPIPLALPSGAPNTQRSPANLIPVWGDWGSSTLAPTSGSEPTEEDFSRSFWVTTREARIVRVWAPRWSMFSRGNAREKARILEGRVQGLEGGAGLEGAAAVDMFVGVGYFAFSYLGRGVRVVWGWDLNPWSVEGARRGAEGNGWGVRVLKSGDGVGWVDEMGRREGEVWRGLVADLSKGVVRVILVQADNSTMVEVFERVGEEIQRLRRHGLETDKLVAALNVRHVNLGLLPTSRSAWKGSVELVAHQKGTNWVHIHENVEAEGIQAKILTVVKEFEKLLGVRGRAECVHVERVKTFAPGVVHCVFDLRIDVDELTISGRGSPEKEQREK